MILMKKSLHCEQLYNNARGYTLYTQIIYFIVGPQLFQTFQINNKIYIDGIYYLGTMYTI